METDVVMTPTEALDALVKDAQELGLDDEPEKALTDRQVRDLMERSVARSYGCPQGLSHLFPGLGSKRYARPDAKRLAPTGK